MVWENANFLEVKMRKKMLMFVATVFTCLGINTLCAAEQVVEKRYHDCHKAVYGRAESYS